MSLNNLKQSSVISLWFLTKMVFIFFIVHTAHANNSLTLAVHPYLSPDVLLKKFTPIAEYLSAETGVKINVKIGSSYEEHIQYIGQNKVDIAYMGPASYVTMINEYGNKPLLARLEVDGRPWFRGNIITRSDSHISSIENLKGKKIAFGDPNSTMSYIVPYFMMHEAGVFTDKRSSYQFLKSHNNVALGVLSGDFDAGAVKPAIYKKYQIRGVRVIEQTPKISEHLFVTRSNLPPELINKLRDAMLAIKKYDEGVTALQHIKKNITGLVSTKPEDYENLQNIISEMQNINK